MKALVWLSRIAAWIAVGSAAILVVASYDGLPTEIALTRWSTAPKSLHLALRVPLINACTLGLAEVLVRSLRRNVGGTQVAGGAVALYVTAAIKATVQGLEWSGIALFGALPIIAAVVIGLAAAAHCFRDSLLGGEWRSLSATRGERLLAALLIAAILALNIPLLTS